jgi:uncharacterized glyoxalase superfamily protein PhnB
MTFTDVTPNLVVADLDRSLAFYRDVLGFEVATTVPDQGPFAFAWMRRDSVSVFLNSEASARLKASAGTNTLFMTVQADDTASGIDALFAAIKDRAPVTMELVNQFYGMREFAIKDPDGYVVMFAQEIR